MDNTPIPQVESHKDLGLILSEDLSWSRHYKFIIARAYKILGLIRCTFASNHSPATLVKLYMSLHGKILITLLHSAMMPLLNERYILL